MLAASPAANARDQRRLIEKTEMSMLVKGGIDMRPDGSVERYSIDHSEKLSPAVTQMIGAQVSAMAVRAVLVDGKPVNAHTNMSLRIVAKPVDEQNFSVRIQSASTGGKGDAAPYKRPEKDFAQTHGAGALVDRLDGPNLYLALKIGTDGRCWMRLSKQPDLRLGYQMSGDGEERKMGRGGSWKRWTAMGRTGHRPNRYLAWNIGPHGFREGTVPPSESGYGEWRAYIPRPCTPVPWRVKWRQPLRSRMPRHRLTLDGSDRSC